MVRAAAVEEAVQDADDGEPAVIDVDHGDIDDVNALSSRSGAPARRARRAQVPSATNNAHAAARAAAGSADPVRMYLREIGQVLDVSESRVSQIMSQAMHRLKAKLKYWRDVPPFA